MRDSVSAVDTSFEGRLDIADLDCYTDAARTVGRVVGSRRVTMGDGSPNPAQALDGGVPVLSDAARAWSAVSDVHRAL